MSTSSDFECIYLCVCVPPQVNADHKRASNILALSYHRLVLRSCTTVFSFHPLCCSCRSNITSVLRYFFRKAGMEVDCMHTKRSFKWSTLWLCECLPKKYSLSSVSSSGCARPLKIVYIVLFLSEIYFGEFLRPPTPLLFVLLPFEVALIDLAITLELFFFQSVV